MKPHMKNRTNTKKTGYTFFMVIKIYIPTGSTVGFTVSSKDQSRAKNTTTN
jgi:hypothetical protein